MQHKDNNYLTIPVSSIGKKLTVTLCGEKANPNAIHFENIASSWLEDFLKEIDLYLPEHQQFKIKGKIQITAEDKIYRMEAKIEYEPLLECARSLTLFREKLEATGKCFFTNKQFSDYSSTSGQNIASDEFNDEVCLTEEDLEAYTYKGNFIHLDEFILDLLQTSLPELPLCTENCMGLCHNCGVNLNEAVTCKLESEPDIDCTHFNFSQI